MNTKKICLFISTVAALGFAATAAADDVTVEQSRTFEQRKTSSAVLPPATTRTERSITTQSGALGETTTRTTEETWTGRLRRVSPSSVSVTINGSDYIVTGPHLSELTTDTNLNQDITIWGHLNQPQKTVEITRYERIQR